MIGLRGVLVLTLWLGGVAFADHEFGKADNAVGGYVSGTSNQDFAKPPPPPDEELPVADPGRAGPEGGAAGGNGGTAGARAGHAGFPDPHAEAVPPAPSMILRSVPPVAPPSAPPTAAPR
jgi:hypothetical protein